MKKIITLTLLTSSLLFSSSLESIGLNVGKSDMSYNQTDHSGVITLGNEPQKSFNSYELYTTLKNDIYGMKPYISYTYSFNSELKNQYVLTGLNKYYSHDKLDLYAGVLVGYGELKWRYNPLNNSKDNNVDANSLIGGAQIGLDYPITTKLSLGINGKYLVHSYETKLNPSNTSNTTIEHDKTTLLSVGLKYTF